MSMPVAAAAGAGAAAGASASSTSTGAGTKFGVRRITSTTKFSVRRIPFPPHTLPRPVLMQGANGPCPLLALVNVLLLRGQLNVGPHADEVSEAALVQALANRALEREAERDRGALRRQPPISSQAAARPAGAAAAIAAVAASASASASAYRVNKQWHIGELMEVLPCLARGLDVNVKFDRADGFETTAALTAFDALGVRLLHGWLLDPQDRRTARALQVGSASYNQVADRLIAYRALLEEHNAMHNPAAVPTSSLALPSPSDDRAARWRRRLLKDGPVIEEWLATTAGQLTVYGLTQLHEQMREGELAALFRSNHFSVLHKRSGRLFILASDEGFLHEPNNAVWERLDEPTGDVEYVDGYFRPLSAAAFPYPSPYNTPLPPPPPPPPRPPTPTAAIATPVEATTDGLLALQLHRDQEAAAREGQRAFAREGVAALLEEGGPLELLRAQDPRAVVPTTAPVSEEEGDGTVVEGGFYLVPGGGREEKGEGGQAPLLFVDAETQRPFTPEDLEAMRAAERAFRRAKEEQAQGQGQEAGAEARDGRSGGGTGMVSDSAAAAVGGRDQQQEQEQPGGGRRRQRGVGSGKKGCVVQ